MTEATPYDLVPYTSFPYPRTHPDRMNLVARLCGMNPAPITACRVLELGCASGGNLIPMAFHLPSSEFVGVEIASRQIEPGHKSIEALGLTNIRIENASILEVDASWGIFDYIICHGVYSWVPAEVQEKILSICRDRLAREGVALVSYNTYPGWHLRESMRHMMLYHSRRFDDAATRTHQSRALLDFVARNTSPESPYGSLLNSEIELLAGVGDDYLYHDLLEERNEPVYFHHFIERAVEKKLSYLGEADVTMMLASNLSPEVSEKLSGLASDIIATEQYMDFIRNRSFRYTLLCHSGTALRRNITPEATLPFSIASPVGPTPSENPDDPLSETFSAEGRGTITTSEPLVKAALRILGEAWPVALPFDDLFQRARSVVAPAGEGPDDRQARETLLSELLQCFANQLTDLRGWQAPMARRVSAAPRVSALARHQVRSSASVTSQLHAASHLDPFAMQLIPLLDGTRSHSELASALAQRAEDRVLRVDADGEPITDRDQLESVMREVLGKVLQQMRSNALLEA
jgi:methyltransferase-like protein/SAM-dependent methyltransferase